MNKKSVLFTGDSLAIAFTTFIGFASHGEAHLLFLPRMEATFFPVLIAWFLIAPWFGLFDEPVISNPKNLWRIALALLFAAPLAAVLRSVLLQNSTLPIFVAILGASHALGVLAWRWLYLLFAKRTKDTT